ncbi:MAG: type III pantothenate kinase [Muribaculaceae bacterium]|nr:type III pantothenate kinase [Muribaculaceae bacterium]
MGYNLTIDQGNTAIKAVIWEHRSMTDSATMAGDFSAAEMAAFIGGRTIDGAIACSVGADLNPVMSFLHQAGIPRIIEMSHDTPTPVINDYRSARTLGLDRLAAAAGAIDMMPGRDLLVADLGTACTYDIVTASGHFLGGNIAPGVGMRLRALHRDTARLPEINSHGRVEQFGSDTESAMRSGAVRGVAAETLYYRTLGCDSPRPVIITGGWASDIRALLPHNDPEIIETRHLVNQGLNSILLYNENI